MICSRSRGALAGSPRYINGTDVAGVVEFRDAWNRTANTDLT
jgi:hypothetical protein